MRIAYLFITIRDLNHPKIWRKWLGNSQNIYIHNKYPLEDIFFKKYCLTKTVKTGWGHIIPAIIRLYEEALKDEENTSFVLLSESCLPVMKRRHIEKILHSHAFNFVENWGENVINEERLLKSSTWAILNRFSVQKIVRHKKEILLRYSKFPINTKNGGLDEYFFREMMKTYKLKHKIIQTTFTYWVFTKIDTNFVKLKEIERNLYALLDSGILEKKEGKNLQKTIRFLSRFRKYHVSHPLEINQLNKKLLKEIIRSNCMFARKFPVDSNVTEYIRKIHEKNSPEGFLRNFRLVNGKKK